MVTLVSLVSLSHITSRARARVTSNPWEPHQAHLPHRISAKSAMVSS